MAVVKRKLVQMGSHSLKRRKTASEPATIDFANVAMDEDVNDVDDEDEDDSDDNEEEDDDMGAGEEEDSKSDHPSVGNLLVGCSAIDEEDEEMAASVAAPSLNRSRTSRRAGAFSAMNDSGANSGMRTCLFVPTHARVGHPCKAAWPLRDRCMISSNDALTQRSGSNHVLPLTAD